MNTDTDPSPKKTTIDTYAYAIIHSDERILLHSYQNEFGKRVFQAIDTKVPDSISLVKQGYVSERGYPSILEWVKQSMAKRYKEAQVSDIAHIPSPAQQGVDAMCIYYNVHLHTICEERKEHIVELTKEEWEGILDSEHSVVDQGTRAAWSIFKKGEQEQKSVATDPASPHKKTSLIYRLGDGIITLGTTFLQKISL